jgi:hypothetical protein
MNQNLDFISFILLVKLKCNRNHIYGLNWLLAITVKKFKIHYMVIRFFYKFHSYIKRKTSHGDFPIGCGTQLA